MQWNEDVGKRGRQLNITPVTHQDWLVFDKMFTESFQADIFYPLMKRRLDLAKRVLCFSKSVFALFAGTIYILRSDNRPAGFIMLKKINDKHLHLHYVAVASEFRRQGLGWAMVSFVLEVARVNGADISLETEAGSPAMALYSSLGFNTDSSFHIYSLVSTFSQADRISAVGLLSVNNATGVITQAKEWLVGTRSSVFMYNTQEGAQLSFRVSRPRFGGACIIHCSLSGVSCELLYKPCHSWQSV